MDNNEYKKAVENFERLAKAMAPYQGEEDQATLAWNLFYLKLQPQYGVQEVIH